MSDGPGAGTEGDRSVEEVDLVAAPSIGELDRLIDRIGALDGVERTMSSIILSTRLQR